MSVYALNKQSTPKTKALPVRMSTLSGMSLTSQENARFNQFWDMLEAIAIHGYIRAAMSVIGRSTIGTWWTLAESDLPGKKGTERERKHLFQFYSQTYRAWDNIKDFQSFAHKLMLGAMYLKYFGRAAYQVLRNSDNQAIGLDFLPGYVIPNVDVRGKFLRPAFIQYPTRNLSDKVEFSNPRDIVYITNPDWQGFPSGGSDVEALSEFALPLDLYLQVAAREYMKNRDKPEAFYILPSDTSEEAFDAFVLALEAKYTGPTNVGRSPIAVQGDLEIKELSKLPADLPYQEARLDTRQEVLAVSGVAGAKLGITDSLSSANLREARREFHETTMIPLFRLIEMGLYEQVHVREFAISGWLFKFNNPDFLTLVERATVDMRYHDMGVYNPNQIRKHQGLAQRTDEFGDKYVDELKADAAKKAAEAKKPQGSPPEGRADNPDKPSNTGEPTLDNQDPPRGDQHDDVTERSLIKELRQWRDFQIKRAKKGDTARPFAPKVIPDYMADAIQDSLKTCHEPEQIKNLFSAVERLLAEETQEDLD